YSSSGSDYVDLLNTPHDASFADDPAIYTWATPKLFLSIVGPKITALRLATGNEAWRSDGSNIDRFAVASPLGTFEGSLWTANGWSVDLNSGALATYSLDCGGDAATGVALRDGFLLASNNPQDGSCVYRLPAVEQVGMFDQSGGVNPFGGAGNGPMLL